MQNEVMLIGDAGGKVMLSVMMAVVRMLVWLMVIGKACVVVLAGVMGFAIVMVIVIA